MDYDYPIEIEDQNEERMHQERAEERSNFWMRRRN